jgi:hypothetical protein
MNIDLSCDHASISPSGYKSMNVLVSNVDYEEILDQIKIEDVIKHFSTKDVLDCIHISDVIDHYGEEELFNNMDLSANFVEITRNVGED